MSSINNKALEEKVGQLKKAIEIVGGKEEIILLSISFKIIMFISLLYVFSKVENILLYSSIPLVFLYFLIKESRPVSYFLIL